MKSLILTYGIIAYGIACLRVLRLRRGGMELLRSRDFAITVLLILSGGLALFYSFNIMQMSPVKIRVIIIGIPVMITVLSLIKRLIYSGVESLFEPEFRTMIIIILVVMTILSILIQALDEIGEELWW